MTGYLTTHVLDTAHGIPADGIGIALFAISGTGRKLIAETVTNIDGRTDVPLVAKGALRAGEYELIFKVGDYFRGKGIAAAQPFLDIVPVRFGIADAAAHYHVPLLVSPFAYSTYRGS